MAKDRNDRTPAMPGGGWVPVPDPTELTTEAVERATEQFRRELGALREILETRLEGNDQQRDLLWDELRTWAPALETRLEQRRREFLDDLGSVRELMQQRLSDLDKAIKLAADDLAKMSVRTETERERLVDESTLRLGAEREFIMAQVEIVRAVMAEKFTAVDGRFEESKVAVDAAFAAAKEAVAEQNKANSQAITKSETATKEQLASLSRVTDAGIAGLSDKITDARDRITVIESLTRGIEQASGQNREQHRDNMGERDLHLSGVVIVLMSFSALISLIAIILTLFLHK
jgi:hypothetical protein